MTIPLIGSASLAPPPVGFSPLGQLTVPRVTTPPPDGTETTADRYSSRETGALAAVVAVVEVDAVAAEAADGTRPRRDSLICVPVSVLLLTLIPVTAPRFS